MLGEHSFLKGLVFGVVVNGVCLVIRKIFIYLFIFFTIEKSRQIKKGFVYAFDHELQMDLVR